MPPEKNPDLLVIGGGVIGLSIAYQAACDGLGVTLLERGAPGREASWAGAGILPPGSWYEDHESLDRLALAAALDQPRWSERLRADTGIDDEYWVCGAAYLETDQNANFLSAAFDRWKRLGVSIERDPANPTAWLAPTEAQVRNPRRLRALEAACRVRGVDIKIDAEVVRVVRAAGEQISAVATHSYEYAAGDFCFAAGCWTPRLVESAGSVATGRPVRGQMLLLRPAGESLDRIVHRYPYYAVPRRDGRVLVGATVEDVGFDKRTTESAYAELLAESVRLDPRLAGARVEASWAGLRPASSDALPLIGPAPGLSNAWIATGHHRSGLQFAPPTAHLISAMIRSTPCDLPAAAFDPSRFIPATV